MSDARRWEDDTGRSRWQPQLDNGQLLWRNGMAGGTLDWERERNRWLSPVLYRWRWWAERKARKEEERRARLFRPAEEE